MAEPRPQLGVEHWDLTTALIRQFGRDELVGIGIVHTLLPGLTAVARRLEWGHGSCWEDREGFASDLISATWVVLHGLAGQTVVYPERVVLDRVRKRLIAQRAAAYRATYREAPLASKDALVLERLWADPRPLPVLDSLAIALRRIGPSELAASEVRLIFEHRVLGFSLAELAAESGDKLAALKYRRKRAEAVLCA